MDTEKISIPQVGYQGEPCGKCGTPLAADQRYCLNCGKRRGEARIDYERYLGGSEEPASPPTAGPPAAAGPAAGPTGDGRPQREVTPLMAAGGLVVLAAILVVGVLIGKSAQGGGGAGEQPQVIAMGGAPTTTGAAGDSTTVSAEFTSDWPEGEEGFTIELGTLPKASSDGAAVEAAKADLVARGATGVGALDSDQFASLPPGNYVLYSGVYDTRADAEAALGPLKASFPDAAVIEVASDGSSGSGGGGGGGASDGGELLSGEKAGADEVVEASTEDLEALQNATGEEYEEIQKNLPDTIATPGEAPPTDDKAPGGGSGATVIK